MMKISVITVSYNSVSTIEDTIVSVISQTYDQLEYIIIDGGSKDGTLEIIDKYRDKIAVVISEPDHGIYDAMNKGITHATGEIVGILNSDDFYADDRVIADVAQKFESTQCEGLYADLVYVNRLNTSQVIRRWSAGEYRSGKFLKGWMPPHPTFFVKRSKYIHLGLYNTSLRSAADYELMLRFIHKHQITLAYLPRVITKMRSGGQSNVSVRNRLKANMEDRAAWKMNDLKPSWYTLTWKPISKLFQFLK